MATGRVIDPEVVMEYRHGEFLLSTSRKRLNLDVVHGFLTKCYWAHGIPREVVARSIEHALCFGIYDGEGAQVGFARVISDFATIAYLGDVFVLEKHRGRELGKWLMECIVQHPACLLYTSISTGASLPPAMNFIPTSGQSIFGLKRAKFRFFPRVKFLTRSLKRR